ncbi:MAG: hypothetical protein MOGMAGMI_02456 [Candidatus Omnitrophica bacterium]|nr:hypothetical protein [Candidatus Omnitrophota bacterium]
MKSPFPYFGGKSRVTNLVWQRFGDVPNYVEPFFGSGAMLLARPDDHDWPHRTETVNDADGMVANFWRAVSHDPEQVAQWADWPVSECDLHARHAWLIGQREDLTRRLEGDPDFYDAKVAGWWLWGICLWIGGCWCSAQGPWRVVDGELLRIGNGQKRQLPHLGDAGRGINRQLPHLGNAGMGVCDEWSEHLLSIMQELANRLRRVRVCCGDWQRVCGPTPTTKFGTTGVFLDPPYSDVANRAEVYATDCEQVAHRVRDWCLARGTDPDLRIALCGYEGEHDALEADGWDVVAWKAKGGYGSHGDTTGRDNATRERIWFSPHCIKPDAKPVQLAMFDNEVTS